MKTIIRINSALVAVGLLASCADSDDVSREDIETISSRLDNIEETLDTPPPVPTEATAETIPPIVVTTETSAPLEEDTATTLSPSEQMNADSIAVCEKYRGQFGREYILEIGAPLQPEPFFYGTCDGESMWFWAYQGDETDSHTVLFNGIEFDEEGEYDGPFILGDAGIPMDATHPAYPDAATLSEVAALPPGSPVCSRHGLYGDKGTLYVDHVGFHAYYYPAVMEKPEGYAAVYFTSDFTGEKGITQWSATDIGLSPFDEDGVWTTSYVSLGACQ